MGVFPWRMNSRSCANYIVKVSKCFDVASKTKEASIDDTVESSRDTQGSGTGKGAELLEIPRRRAEVLETHDENADERGDAQASGWRHLNGGGYHAGARRLRPRRQSLFDAGPKFRRGTSPRSALQRRALRRRHAPRALAGLARILTRRCSVHNLPTGDDT